MRNERRRIFIAVALVAFAAVTRYFLQDLPNVETITVSALLAGAFLGGVYTIAVPLAIIAVTDIAIGNSSILLFTWSAWAAIGVFGWLRRRHAGATFRFTCELTALGVGSSVFFYLWTNFGVWLLFDFYPATFSGLIASYVAGLPFLKYQVLGNLVIVPVVAGSIFTLVRTRSTWTQQLHRLVPKRSVK